MTPNALRLLASRTEKLTAGLKSMQFTMVKASADVVQASISRQIGKDAPRRRVAGGSVGVDQRTLSRGENPRILVREHGALHLLSNDTKPHLILPKASGSGRSRRSRSANYSGSVGTGVHPLRTPYGPRYAVHHPGTSGKRTWQHGVDEARPLIGKAMQNAAAAEITKAFR